jgi:hypothetical protein
VFDAAFATVTDCRMPDRNIVFGAAPRRCLLMPHCGVVCWRHTAALFVDAATAALFVDAALRRCLLMPHCGTGQE